MRRPGWRAMLLPAMLAAAASPALANAGTALIWLSVFHLFFGNLVIGILEALVAQWVLRRRHGIDVGLIGWMMLANYATMAAGVFGLGPLITWLEPQLLGRHPMANLPWLIALVLLAAFAVTVLVEWGILHAGVRFATSSLVIPGLRGMTWRANLAAQCVSYALLIPLYLSASGTSLLTEVRRERDLAFVKTPAAIVFYVAPDGSLMKLTLDGRAPVSVTPADFLTAAISFYGGEERFMRINSRSFHREVIDLRPPGPWRYAVEVGFWPIDGLRIEDRQTGTRRRLALEMPFFLWYPKDATVLPGDQVVYQVKDYLVVYDLHTRQIADLGPGRNPVVIMPGRKFRPNTAQ